MKRRLVIHIGMGKSGSTSIQKTLAENHSILIEQGIYYLGLMLERTKQKDNYEWALPFGWPKFVGLPKEEGQKQLIRAFKELDDQLPNRIHTLVWSNESLFTGYENVSSVISELKSLFTVEVVAYVRRPDAWILSAYLQWGIKHKTYSGPIQSFSTWAKNNPYSVTPQINSWQDGTESIRVFNFDAVGDITEHFINLLPISDITSLSIHRSNDTPSGLVHALFAYFNSTFEGQVHPNLLGNLLGPAGVFNIDSQKLDYNELLPQNTDIENFLSDNASELNSINALLESSGQDPFEEQIKPLKDFSTNQGDINRALMKVIFHLHTRVQTLEDKLKVMSEQ